MSLVAATAAPSDQGGVLAIIIAISAILCLPVAVVQAYKWGREFVDSRASARLAAEMADEAEAKVLRMQNEATRVYLRERSDALLEQITRDVAEFESAESRLSRLEQRPLTDLDRHTRSVIEASIRPLYVRRNQREWTVIGLLVALVLLSVSPYPAQGYIRAFVELLNDPTAWSDSSVAVTVGAGIAVIGLVAFLGVRWLLNHKLEAVPRQQTVAIVASFVLAASVAGLVVGLFARENAQLLDAQISNQIVPSSASLNRANADGVRSSVLLSLSTPIIGIVLGGSFAGWRARRSRVRPL